MQKKAEITETQEQNKSKESPLTSREIKNLLLVEILAPTDAKFSPLTSKERSEIAKNIKAKLQWKDVFLPVRNIDIRDKYVKLFEMIDLEIQKEDNH